MGRADDAARVTVVQRANPFDVSRAYRITMRLALAMAIVPGLGTGLYLVLLVGLRLPMTAGWPPLAQAHGQVQALGFVLVFIVAVALQLFPRFLAAPARHAERAIWGAALLAGALTLRLVVQPLEPGIGRGVLLGLVAVAVPIGLVLAGSAFHGLRQATVQPGRGPAAAWRRFVAVGGVAAAGVLGLWIWSCAGLALGWVVVEMGGDEALIHLELAGFATSIVLAIGSRIFGRFLLLRTRPSLERRVPLLAVGWGVGLALTAAGWLAGPGPGAGAWLRWLGATDELVVVLIWVGLIGLYARPTRGSGTPYVTDPTRRWVRCAFGFLVLGLGLDAVLYGREAFFGSLPTFVQLSAARHAIGQGFLLPLMVSMAARLLPIVSADVLKHRPRLEWTVDLLLVGALLRVVAEGLGGYAGVSGPVAAAGGTISVVAFDMFAIQLWSSLVRLPRATLDGA